MSKAGQFGKFAVYVYDEKGQPHKMPHCHVRWAESDVSVALPTLVHLAGPRLPVEAASAQRVTARELEPWETTAYQRIAAAKARDGKLEVEFSDHTRVELDGVDAFGPAARSADWSSLQAEPYELRVRAGDRVLEVPWSTIRSLSDRAFAEHLQTASNRQAREIGARLRELRERRGLTAKELAKRAELSPQSISRIELGRHDVVFGTLKRILDVLGYSIAELASSDRRSSGGNGPHDRELKGVSDKTVRGDSPIESKTEDELGRSKFAQLVVSYLARVAPGTSLVVGLTGPWGSGKSSVLNLIDEQLRESDNAVVIRFNPWFFAGSEALVRELFEEMGRGLKGQEGDLRKLGSALAMYGEALASLKFIPVAGDVLAGGGKAAAAIGKALQGGPPPDARQLRDQLRGNLSELSRQLVVLIDDIDRLTDAETMEVLRLVRLVGDLPNVIYVLAFDRERLMGVLNRTNIDPAYLDKIIQVSLALNEPSDEAIDSLLRAELAKHLPGEKMADLDGEHGANVYYQIVLPLCRTVRDIKRLSQLLPASFEIFGEEVDTADLIALEAVAVIVPEAHAQLPEIFVPLTDVQGASPIISPQDTVAVSRRVALENWLQLSPPHSAKLRSLLDLCFPASLRYFTNYHYGRESLARWRKDRLVAHPAVLRTYLDRWTPEAGPSTATVRRLRASLRDPNALRDALSEVAPSDLAPLLERLLDYRDDFGVEDAPGVPVLLGLLPLAREWAAGGVLAVSPRILLDAILISLLRAVPDADRASYIEALFADLRTLSERHHLLLVCHESEGGIEALVEAGIHAKLVSQLIKLIEATPLEELTEESELRRLCQTLHEAGGRRARKKLMQIASDDRALIAVVVGSASLRRAQAMGSVLVHQQAEVFWDLLEQVFGKEELRGRLVQVLNRAAEGEIEVDAFVLGLIAERLTSLASAEATIVQAAPAAKPGDSEEGTLSSAEARE